MAYSDDDEEEETVPQSVLNYHFEDDDKEPVSFSVLPIQWNDKEIVEGNNTDVFLRGISDDGLQTLYKPVKAWRFDLSNIKPEILVLTKDNLWIKLQKPRKSFEEVIRTVLITVHCLHYIRRNPEASGKSLWEHLFRAFGFCDVKPAQNDFVDHMDLICEAVKRDDSLAKSKFLLTFLEEKSSKKWLPDEDNPSTAASGFIVDDMLDDVEEDDSNDDDYFESVCAICDNGGDLLCCDGICLRSFHTTVEDGEDSMCESLGLTKKEVKAIQNFVCTNCQHKQHQCFVCRQLGSSDKSSGAEVFQCVSATCGYFYHPRCIAKLLHKGNRAEAEGLEKRIASGESFTCPLHKCCVCKQGEVKTDPELQFAVCRRCPKSYHRKCLPQEIAFMDIEEEGIITRAWDVILKNRVLIYCLEHEIDDELGTPVRDHAKFPVFGVKKTIFKENKKISESTVGRERTGLKKKNLASGDSHEGKLAVRSPREGATTEKYENFSSRPDTMRKGKEIDPSRKSLMNQKNSQKMDKASAANKNKASSGDRLFNYMQDSEQVKPGKRDSAESNKNVSVMVASKYLISEAFTLDGDSERRLLKLMDEAVSSITIEEIIKKREVPSTHTSSIKHVVDKTITLGKVEGSVQAVRTALGKLVDGNNIEDAKAVCEPEVLNQIFKWKDKLKVYLAPFLYGPRYTSFGRHFTKVDKLQEIVDRLHWYAQDGDMIVDFCCGANDFSYQMKKKLEETGKKCFYKNYDVLQAKNNFNFEKRDWLTVQKKELPPGSRLIMGLNPPFGVKASLANRFINKALEFDPKLLILIVPLETQRLDKKKSPYELVWEDDQFLSGKSFYLPGSVDDKDKQMDDWNILSPPLSLWSRPDWAAKHKEIAQKQCHLSKHLEKSHLDKNGPEANASAHQTGNPGDSFGDTSYVDNPVLVNGDVPMELDEPEQVIDGDNGNLLLGNGESHESRVCGRSQSNDFARKREKEEENGTRGRGEMDSNKLLRKRKNEEENIRRIAERASESNDRSRWSVSSGRQNIRGTREKSWDGQSSARPASRDEMYNIGRSHEPLEATYGGNMVSLHGDIGGKYGFGGTQRVLDGPDGMIDHRYRGEVWREADLRSQIRMYGQDPDIHVSRGYLQGHSSNFDIPPSSSAPYGHFVSAPGSSSYGMSTPAMQRYASPLDELNYHRRKSFGSVPLPPQPPPQFGNGMGLHDRQLLLPPPPPPPQFGNGMGLHDPTLPPTPPPQFGNGMGLHDPPGGYGVDPMGFAPGPHHPYPYGHSGGWVND